MVSKAVPKFAVQRWADLHIIALDRENGMITERRVREALAGLTSAEAPSCDLVVYVDESGAVPVWWTGEDPVQTVQNTLPSKGSKG